MAQGCRPSRGESYIILCGTVRYIPYAILPFVVPSGGELYCMYGERQIVVID